MRGRVGEGWGKGRREETYPDHAGFTLHMVLKVSAEFSPLTGKSGFSSVVENTPVNL